MIAAQIRPNRKWLIPRGEDVYKRQGGTCADINGRGRVAVGRNVAIKQHIAHVFGSAAAQVQSRRAAL